jgi:hypothetical protein
MKKALALGLAAAVTFVVGCGDSSPGQTDARTDSGRPDGADAAGKAGCDGGAGDGPGGTGGAGGAGGSAAGAGGTGGSATAGSDGGIDGDAAIGEAGVEAGGDRPDTAPDSSTNVTDVRVERLTADASDAADAAVPPGAATDLSAAVLDRRGTSFKLSWKAPASGGGSVTTYDIRVAKVAITQANFDDPGVGVVPYVGPPAPAGQPDSAVVTGLYIETGYSFAVAAVDAAGFRGPIVATSSAVAAHFNQTILQAPAGAGSAESFGYSVSGADDVNGDGKADILVGTYNVKAAYLYLGSTTFPAGAPSVKFTGAAMSFGTGVMQIGDIDKDGLSDLAIASPLADPPVVYIYKGRATWPATLSDTDATYTITGDASYVNANLGLSMGALGDFDGDGTDDFVIGASAYNTRQGRVVIVRGSATFSSFTLPSATRAITIDGDAALDRTQFGTAVVGLGTFYATGGATLIVSAPGLGTATSTSANEGRVYAFHGQNGTAGAIPLASADHSIVGPGKAAKIGVILVNLGPIVNGLPSVGVGNTADTLSVAGQNGTAFIQSGTSATGPFASRQVVYLSGQTTTGQVLAGGGFSGRNVSVSLLGSSTPDLAIAAFQSPAIYIVDGDALAGAGNPGNLAPRAAATITLPPDWLSTSLSVGSLVRDVDGDGHPDLTIGEQAAVGRVAVFW